MQKEKQQKVDEIIQNLNTELKIDEKEGDAQKLEKQMAKIVKNLISDISQLTKKKFDKEEKLFRKGEKRELKQRRIFAVNTMLNITPITVG